MSVQAWNASIDAFIEHDIPDAMLYLVRVVSIAALNKVVLKSPVDTGRFRGAWIVTIDERTDDAPEALDDIPGSKAGRAASSGTKAITAGLAVIQGAQPFGHVILQNNVEYAEDLEDGGSKQAPQGVLAVTVAELEAILS